MADAPAPEPAAPAAPGRAAEPVFERDVARFIEHLRFERRVAPRTLALYQPALLELQSHATADGVPLQQAQAHHLRRWTAKLRERGLASRSIAITLAAWRGLYAYWGRERLVTHNPVDGIRPPKPPQSLPKALPVEQAVALAQAESPSESPVLRARDHVVAELLYGCGLRVAELIGLDALPSDAALGWIDAADGTAHVLGKGSKRRSVPVGGPALQALQGWLQVRTEWARPDEAALLVSQRGTRLSAAQLRARLKMLGLAAGLPTDVHPHMLRHSYASHLLQSSGDLRGVQELLGHANISTTQVYTKLDFQHLAKVYDAAHPRAKKRPGG